MKPRIFIGSSGASRNFAEAIYARLEDIGECTVWTAGAFALSTSTLTGLMTSLRDSDFGVFVFAADDDAVIKGELLKVPRDNVIYEAGLFSGYLSPERCFIAVPKSVEVHVPTDLAGMTRGFYDDTRRDHNDNAAVLTFSNDVKKQIVKHGLFKGSDSEQLRDLVVRFECCQAWVKDEKERVDTKRQISGDIDTFCKHIVLNKHRFLAQERTGYYIALLATIRFHPEDRDWELILKMKPHKIPPGFVYYNLLDAVESLKTSGNATAQQLKKLYDWLKTLPDANEPIKNRIEGLIA